MSFPCFTPKLFLQDSCRAGVISYICWPILPRGGVLGSTFAGYVPLDSQNPYPIIVYSVTNYRPHLSQFWANG